MKRRIQHTLVLGMSFLSFSACSAQERKKQSVSKNGMEVQWYFKENRIFFTMKAPTEGWITIGFNTTRKMTNAYLLMGRITENRAEVVEHYTLSPGEYKSVQALGGISQIQDVHGYQKEDTTIVHFSLPIAASSQYQKDLFPGNNYIMILAYSEEDDFQHHSIMRTSIHIEL